MAFRSQPSRWNRRRSTRSATLVQARTSHYGLSEFFWTHGRRGRMFNPSTWQRLLRPFSECSSWCLRKARRKKEAILRVQSPLASPRLSRSTGSCLRSTRNRYSGSSRTSSTRAMRKKLPSTLLLRQEISQNRSTRTITRNLWIVRNYEEKWKNTYAKSNRRKNMMKKESKKRGKKRISKLIFRKNPLPP